MSLFDHLKPMPKNVELCGIALDHANEILDDILAAVEIQVTRQHAQGMEVLDIPVDLIKKSVNDDAVKDESGFFEGDELVI